MTTKDEQPSDVDGDTSIRITRTAVLTFPESEVSTAAEFAIRLEQIRKAYPRWKVEGKSVFEGSGDLIPHRPELRQGKLNEKRVKRDVLEYLANTELEAAKVVASSVDDLELSVSEDLSSGNIVTVPTIKLRQNVIIEVPPHVGQQGTVTEIENSDCFRVTFEGHSWWCSRNEVSLAVTPQPQIRTQTVSLNTLEEAALLRKQNELLITAIRLVPSRSQFLRLLTEEQQMCLTELL